MQITVLGYWGAYPAAGEATSGYLLQSKSKAILIDCGSAVLSQLQKYIELSDLDAVIITHYHSDHTADIHCLQYAVMIDSLQGKRQNILPIYAHNEDKQFESLTYREYTEGVAVRSESNLIIDDFNFSFIKTIHPAPCLAIKITQQKKTVTYTADTEYFDGLVDFARYSDILLSEASLYREYENKVPGHLSAAQAGKLAAEAEASGLILTHLPHYGDHKQLIKESREYFKNRIQLAETGLTITL